MNTTMLQEIAYQLKSGNPWWAMLTLNEYPEVDTILRKVFAKQFVERVGEVQCSSELGRLLIAGVALQDIPVELHSEIGSKSRRPSKHIPHPRLHSSEGRRLACRQRAATMFPTRQTHLAKRAQTRNQVLYAVQN